MIDRISRYCALLAAWLFVATGGMLSFEVAARYIFNAPTIWAAELSQLFLIWACFLAAAWLLHTRSHISISLVTGLLAARLRWASELLAMLTIAVFAFWIAWHGYRIFADSLETGRSTGTMMNLPNWLTEISLPFGFALLGAQAVVEAWRLLQSRQPSDSGATGFMGGGH